MTALSPSRSITVYSVGEALAYRARNLHATASVPLYYLNESNHCPGCSRQQWNVGRSTAECVFCETALPIANKRIVGGMGANG